MTPDSATATVAFPSELVLDPGAPRALALRFTTRTDPGLTTFALALDAVDVGVIQPGNPLFDVSVLPAPGRAFPLETRTATYGATTLAEWSNYPNPFAAGRASTAFAYYLPNAATVTLEIWTARGERVVTLLDAASRAPGLHQDDRWDGRNGVGQVVQNGVYVAELTVREDGGGTERVHRKVAVVR